VSSVSKINDNPPPGYSLFQEGRREILVRNEYKDVLRHQGLLDPSKFWEHTDSFTHMMGRGEVLLFTGHGEVAVRKYRHGGLLRRLTVDTFMFGSRPFKEVEVTEKAKSAGIPTLEILAAIIERERWGRYRGYLITRYLPRSVDLMQYLSRQPKGKKRREAIEKAGEVMRKMHQLGIYHADLHLKNILVEERETPKVYLIDFDKSKTYSYLNPSKRMKNLKRLDRSAEKLREAGLALTKKDKDAFCHAYAKEDQEIRPFIRAYCVRYRWYKLLYRGGWWIGRILSPRQRPSRKSVM